MLIHFVCRGNTYRSRLAEAYLNSKRLKNIKVISSGIEANNNLSGPISWYAQRLIQKNKIVNFESRDWQVTTGELLKKGDYTVFMEKKYFEFCKNKLGFDSQNYEIWNILDLIGIFTEQGKIGKSEDTFEEIKKLVDGLVKKLNEKYE